MKKAAEQFGGLLPANAQSAEVRKPGDGALHSLSGCITAHAPTMLSDVIRLATVAMGGDHFNALISELFIQGIAVMGLVSNYSLPRFRGEHKVEKPLHQSRHIRGRTEGRRRYFLLAPCS